MYLNHPSYDKISLNRDILQGKSDSTGENTSSSKRVSDNGTTSVQRSSGSRGGRSSGSAGDRSTGNTAGRSGRGSGSSVGTGSSLGLRSGGGVLGGGGRSEGSSGGSRGAVGATSHVELLRLSQDTGVLSRVGEEVDLVSVTILGVSMVDHYQQDNE